LGTHTHVSVGHFSITSRSQNVILRTEVQEEAELTYVVHR